MATALLVLILERSRMVGILKSLGSTRVYSKNIFVECDVYNSKRNDDRKCDWAVLVVRKKTQADSIGSCNVFCSRSPCLSWDHAFFTIEYFCFS